MCLMVLLLSVGVGYQMAIVKKPTCNTAAVTSLIQSHVSGARLNTDFSAELSYVLPHESKAHFSQLFTELDQQKETLGIVSYGASVTTMDEVFIRSFIALFATRCSAFTLHLLWQRGSVAVSVSR